MEAEAETQAASVVEIVPGRASIDVLLDAIDSVLRSGMPGLRVGLALPAEDERRATVEALTVADSRVVLMPPGEPRPQGEIVFEMPAGARPQPRTLPAVATLVRERNLASVSVPLPGRHPALAGLGLHGKLRAHSASGTGAATLRPAEVDLRSTASRGEPGPPPPGTLAEERAEHLRHRARSATMRARMDRNAHRLSRERLQTRHERARRYLAEQRLGRTGPGAWTAWRVRNVGRRVAGVPGVFASAARSVRVFVRRARRYAVDRRRSRKLAA
jgi:hypothetical protein